MQTIFFYDWNVDGNGFIWPGLIYSDDIDYNPYIRMDLSDDERQDAEEDGNTQFNDDDTRSKTYLKAEHLQFDVYHNNDYVYFTHVKDAETDQIVLYNNLQMGGKKKFTFWDITGFQIIGKTLDGEFLDPSLCTSEKIVWNADSSHFAFKYDEKLYFFYSSNPAISTVLLNNLTTIDEYGSLYVFIQATNDYSTVSTIRYVMDNGSIKDCVQHKNEIVGLYAEAIVADRLTYYETNSLGELTVTEFFRTSDNYGTYWVWAKNLRKTYTAKIKDNTTAEEVLDAALSEPKNVWKTPEEFYADFKPTEKMKKGKHGFIRALASLFNERVKEQHEKETIPVWWWCQSLRNWCTFKHTRFQRIELFVWNGKNGWDPFSKIMRDPRYAKEVMATYYYDMKRFTRGAYFAAQINYDKMYYMYSSIRLKEDTKFSQYDENTFQTVKIGSVYLNNKGTRRYPFTVGIPPVMRLPSGELQLVYQMKLPGMSWAVEVMHRKSLDFINSVCLAYFGKGDDKTIFKDWKRFNAVKDVSEEHANEVITDDKSTLIYQPEINTIREDNEILNVSFAIPRQYPETQNGVADSFAEEWSK